MNWDKLTPVRQMRGDDPESTAELERMYERAMDYLRGNDWCVEARNPHFGFGLPPIVALFLVQVDVAARGREWLWVVEGDLPSAYLVTDHAGDAASALEVYTELMTDWITAVRTGRALEEVFPVGAPPDLEHAKMLESRVESLISDIIPFAAMA